MTKHLVAGNLFCKTNKSKQLAVSSVKGIPAIKALHSSLLILPTCDMVL